MSQGRSWIFTKNNPTETLDEFFEHMKATGAESGRVQLERGNEGTLHFQFCLNFASNKRFNYLKKHFPGCHIEKAHNMIKAWNYCGKAESRVAGPLEWGCPKASRNVKGDVKARNALLANKDPV